MTVDAPDAALTPDSPRGAVRRAPVTTGPPRLLIRFAAYLAIGLALTAAAILVFVRHSNTQQAEANARERAQLVAAIAMPLGLDAGRLSQPFSGHSRATLDRFFRTELQRHTILSAAVYRRDGRRLYTIGRRTPRRESAVTLRSVLRDVPRSTVRTGRAGKRLAVYTPFYPQASVPGVLVLEQDYEPIARGARDAFLPIAGVLLVAMIGLFLLFIPVLRRITGHLRTQMGVIQHRAMHDDLTDLPNRALMHDRIEQALLAAQRAGDSLAIMLLDLDRFKEINDTLGHHAGDVLLQEVAARLRETVRASDTVARLGGDEFGILSPETSDVVDAITLAERLRRAIEAPLQIDGMNLDVESSIGIALFPAHGRTVDELLKHADFAMYAAKQRGTSHELYNRHDEPDAPAQIGLIGDFRRALDEQELVVHYQPAVDLRNGVLRGVEALVRWRHPRHGLLLPSEFVPVVEQTSLIRPLTVEVLDQALEQSRQWLESGLDLQLAVNLSPRSLQDPNLAEELLRLLRKWSISAARLDLEITESTVMANPKRAMEALDELRAIGVGLVLDDFGTGYSSLTFLRKLPVDKIKIDRSFVQGMATSVSDGVIVRSLIDLAHNLGMRVVAEGVENEVVWDELARLGCDAAQGFYLSTPRAGDDLTDWIAGHRREEPRLRAAV